MDPQLGHRVVNRLGISWIADSEPIEPHGNPNHPILAEVGISKGLPILRKFNFRFYKINEINTQRQNYLLLENLDSYDNM